MTEKKVLINEYARDIVVYSPDHDGDFAIEITTHTVDYSLFLTKEQAKVLAQFIIKHL